MRAEFLLVGLMMVIVGAFGMSSSSIGAVCYNDEAHTAFKDANPSNWGFLLASAVMAGLAICSGLGSCAYGAYAD